MSNMKSLIQSVSIDEMCSLLEKFNPAKIYEKNQYIFHQSEKADCFYFLKSGKIKTFSNSPEGDEKTVFVFGEKGIFAASSFFSNEIRRSSAIALTKSELILIDKKMVDYLIKHNHKFALCIIQDMSRDINIMLDQITSTSFLNAKQKVAFFLSNCIENNQYFIKDHALYLNLTQDDISKMLSLSRPTINKTLSYFKNRGWIEPKYKSICILDYSSLKSYFLVL